MNLLQLCFDGAEDGFVELSIGGVARQHRRWVDCTKLSGMTLPSDVDVFFGPALRGTESMGKDAVIGSQVCWVDIDRNDLPRPVLPPTAVVQSGHGWHMYWLLNRWLRSAKSIEKINSAIANAIGGDSCHNVDRIMRMPGTMNCKREPYVECRLVNVWPGRVYTPEQLYLSTQLDIKTIRKITTGDRRGFRSRSERDYVIIRAMIAIGLDDDTIETVFTRHECGDKYRDPTVDGRRYLAHTIGQLRRTEVEQTKRNALLTADDGYYIVSNKGKRRLSTFTLEPVKLLEGDREDSIMCNMHTAGTEHVWKGEVFPVSAFSSVRNLTKRLTKAGWVWLGRDGDVKVLQMHLVATLQDMGLPRAKAVQVIGRHDLDGDPRKFFVASSHVYASDGSCWPTNDAPIVLVDSGRESPTVELVPHDVDAGFIHELANTLPRINEPGVIWPLIGWFMAAPMKIDIEHCGFRFPILNTFGTRGSGKTTTILRVFHPLLGYTEEQGYDANTTRFVALSLLGSSNAIPIAFSEFRVATATDFTRYVLLAYDTGHDPRGRADQTTVDYPLLSPFSLDGEDMLEDPASLERILAVQMSPHSISHGTDCSAAFDRLYSLDLCTFASSYITHALASDVPALMDGAEQDIWDAFPEELPTRVRKNITVVWAGILSYVAYMKSCGECTFPSDGARIMYDALCNIYSIALGRAPTAADEFCEFVINQAARGTKSFPWVLADNVVWFQLMPAFEYFLGRRAMQRKQTLSRGAIRAQLLELTGEYTIEPRVMIIGKQKVMAYGVGVVKAHDAGLDVPTEFTTKTLTFNIE